MDNGGPLDGSTDSCCTVGNFCIPSENVPTTHRSSIGVELAFRLKSD